MGQASPGRPFTERDAPAPATPYARSKLYSETRLEAAATGGGAGMGRSCARRWCMGRERAATSAAWCSSCAPACRCRWARRRRPRASSASTTWPMPWCAQSSIRARPTRSFWWPMPRPRRPSASFGTLPTRSGGACGHRMCRRRWCDPRSGSAGRARDVQRLFDPLELDTSRIRTLLDWSPPVTLAEGVRRAVTPQSSALTRRRRRRARGSRRRAGWSRSPCRRRPSARRTWLPSCRPCARPRRGWRCSSRSRW